SCIHDRFEVEAIRERLKRLKAFTSPVAYQREREKYLRRMYDLGEFMKALKQQFTRWFNKRHDRSGTLWEARYKSVLVEGARDPLRTMAAYIDLNAVRAGICDDPESYRWCGYGEAMGGRNRAREGLQKLAEISGRSTDWRMVRRMYRKLLYTEGEARGLQDDGTPLKKGFSKEKVIEVWEENGEIALSDMLRCRIRYFSDGAVIGSRSFVEAFYTSCAERFGPNRQKGGSRMKGACFKGLHALRNLQLRLIS
ncbi:MAG: chemotaxis protein CheW, partial [Verrucomicrobiota bacterium]